MAKSAGEARARGRLRTNLSSSNLSGATVIRERQVYMSAQSRVCSTEHERFGKSSWNLPGLFHIFSSRSFEELVL